jgi:hypothetical protein
MAALNVLGETLHRFSGVDWKNMKKVMTKGLAEKTVVITAHACRHSS